MEGAPDWPGSGSLGAPADRVSDHGAGARGGSAAPAPKPDPDVGGPRPAGQPHRSRAARRKTRGQEEMPCRDPGSSGHAADSLASSGATRSTAPH
eukprot:8549203-Pyramimonas_sp.AAC.1